MAVDVEQVAPEFPWPPEPSWDNAYRLVGIALQWWDLWCPDDGRVRATYAALAAFQCAPSLDTRKTLVSATAGLEASVAMARQAAVAAIGPKLPLSALLDSVAGIALFSALALRWLVRAVDATTESDRARCYARALNDAGMANIFGGLLNEE